VERAEEAGDVQLQEAGQGGQAMHCAGRSEETTAGMYVGWPPKFRLELSD
jgi:hypothetical protein